MLGRIAIDWVTGRSLDGMELLVVRLNVQSGHHKLSASGARGDRANLESYLKRKAREADGARMRRCSDVITRIALRVVTFALCVRALVSQTRGGFRALALTWMRPRNAILCVMCLRVGTLRGRDLGPCGPGVRSVVRRPTGRSHKRLVTRELDWPGYRTPGARTRSSPSSAQF